MGNEKKLSVEEVNNKLLSAFKDSANKKQISNERISINRMDKDFSVFIPFKVYSDIRQKAFDSGIMIKATENLDKYQGNQGVCITLCNGYVIGVINKSLGCDLGTLKSEMSTTHLRNEFNLFVKSELTNNKKFLISELRAI